MVVVGGDMARAGDLLLDPARIGLRRHALDAVAHTPVLASELGERASLLGAPCSPLTARSSSGTAPCRRESRPARPRGPERGRGGAGPNGWDWALSGLDTVVP